jgi:hypothetical protein
MCSSFRYMGCSIPPNEEKVPETIAVPPTQDGAPGSSSPCGSGSE